MKKRWYDYLWIVELAYMTRDPIKIRVNDKL